MSDQMFGAPPPKRIRIPKTLIMVMIIIGGIGLKLLFDTLF